MITSLNAVVGAPVLLEELKRKPGRRRTLRAVGARGTAIVKIYATARAATVAARVTALSGGPASPRIPRVLMVEPERGIVVLSEVPGTPLREAVLAGDAAACRGAGAALGGWHRFWHGTAPEALRPHTTERELEILRSCAEDAPQPVAAAVLASWSAASREEWAPVTAIHRDLYEEQVLIGDEVGLIDLDDAAIGPPELDIANLCAHLELLGLRVRRDLSRMQRELLEGYTSAVLPLDPALFARCRELALLRLACIHRNPALVERARLPPPMADLLADRHQPRLSSPAHRAERVGA